MSQPDVSTYRETDFISAELARIAAPRYQASAVFTDPHRTDNPIVYATRAFFSFTGYRPGDVIGRNCRFLQGPETDPDSVARIREALASESELDIVLVNYRRDGSLFLNRLRIRPLYDLEGRLHRFAGYQQPIGHVLEQSPHTALHLAESSKPQVSPIGPAPDITMGSRMLMRGSRR